MYNVEIYVNKNGKSEIYKYLANLGKSKDKDSRIKLKKIDLYIKLLKKYGLSLNETYIKKIDKELWELRPLRDRILFASYSNNKFILLSVFMKQTQKTPNLEILKARRLLEDYKKRSEEI